MDLRPCAAFVLAPEKAAVQGCSSITASGFLPRKTSHHRDHRGPQGLRTGLVLGCWIWLSWGVHAFGVEDDGLDFGFGTLSGNFLTLPREVDSSRIADSNDDFTVGANYRMGWRNQGFLCNGVAVRGNRDPGIFCGTNYEIESGWRLWGWSGGRRTGVWGFGLHVGFTGGCG